MSCQTVAETFGDYLTFQEFKEWKEASWLGLIAQLGFCCQVLGSCQMQKSLSYRRKL